jgi:hypothetical protein
MKKKTSIVIGKLDELANVLEDKTLAAKEVEQSRQESAKLRSQLEEPSQKVMEFQSKAKLAMTQTLKIVEEVKNQEILIKSLKTSADDSTTSAKNKALLLYRKRFPPRMHL